MAALPEDIGIAQSLVAQGYFNRVAAGDQRAASLFARLFAHTANPDARTNSWGWLRKGGGTNVDGWAEDAVVYGNDPNQDFNVVDLVGGAGAPGATLASTTTHTKPRRIGVDTWAPPKPLTADEFSYLKGFNPPGTTPQPKPCPDPSAHLPKPPKPYVGDAAFDAIFTTLEADMKRAGQPGLNGQSGRWAGRICHDYYVEGLSMDASIAKHRVEWCQLLGIPVV